jgi:hypothetical protein
LSKRRFLKKSAQKFLLLLRVAEPRQIRPPDEGVGPQEQKFFGAFFQKSTASFPL